MRQPTPAIVTQHAARRLPRWVLWALCIAYVVPGFVGRQPWKNADIASFGYMFTLAHDPGASWWSPKLLGLPPEVDALLPYWLGAAAIRLGDGWLAADFAARLPFAALLMATLVLTWYAVYQLARHPQAQPVAFAFGGEATPTDYARAMADGALLAMLASLGLAQLSHETTPALTQLAGAALAFHAAASLNRKPGSSVAAMAVALVVLSLSGAPAVAWMLGFGVALLSFRQQPGPAGAVAVIAFATALAAGALGLWRWRLGWADLGQSPWHHQAQLLLWFTWPTWPFALWTLWRWRRQLGHPHVLLPLLFIAIPLGTMLSTSTADRALLLSLPAFAALGAFALPTFSRSFSALIDWFSVLFFTALTGLLWLYWLALQTGTPQAASQALARLLPGYTPTVSLLALALALAATSAWIWLVRWRVGRHRTAVWKSLALPAGGWVLFFFLTQTLWLSPLNYAQSYAPLVQRVSKILAETPGCVQLAKLTRAQTAAFVFHGQQDLRPFTGDALCPWLVVDADHIGDLNAAELRPWRRVTEVRRPADRSENVIVFRRQDVVLPRASAPQSVIDETAAPEKSELLLPAPSPAGSSATTPAIHPAAHPVAESKPTTGAQRR